MFINEAPISQASIFSNFMAFSSEQFKVTPESSRLIDPRKLPSIPERFFFFTTKGLHVYICCIFWHKIMS